MLMTPREGLLQAENDRLKAENQYLRAAIDNARECHVTPYNVIEEVAMTGPLPQSYSLPHVGGVRGALVQGNNYAVLASVRYAPAEEFQVGYYCDAMTLKSMRDYNVNELFPWMHGQFIRGLMKALDRN